MRVFNGLINTTVYTAYGNARFHEFWDPVWVSSLSVVDDRPCELCSPVSPAPQTATATLS